MLCLNQQWELMKSQIQFNHFHKNLGHKNKITQKTQNKKINQQELKDKI